MPPSKPGGRKRDDRARYQCPRALHHPGRPQAIVQGHAPYRIPHGRSARLCRYCRRDRIGVGSDRLLFLDSVGNWRRVGNAPAYPGDPGGRGRNGLEGLAGISAGQGRFCRLPDRENGPCGRLSPHGHV